MPYGSILRVRWQILYACVRKRWLAQVPLRTKKRTTSTSIYNAVFAEPVAFPRNRASWQPTVAVCSSPRSNGTVVAKHGETVGGKRRSTACDAAGSDANARGFANAAGPQLPM